MSNEQEIENFDELAMEQSLLFSDNLKDLKNLRSQLYSAAEYFELSYSTDDHKQFVVNTLKDYAIKAIVNSVDHLGSVSFKVNSLMNEKFEEVSGSELRVSCIAQRIRTCKELIDREGLCQQSLLITAPRYHKQYTLPVGESIADGGSRAEPKYEEKRISPDNETPFEFKPVTSTTSSAPLSLRKSQSILRTASVASRSASPKKVRSPSPLQQSGKHLGADAEKKRAGLPLPIPNPLARSGSLAIRSTMLNPSSSILKQHPPTPVKSASMKLHAERNEEESEQNHSKGKKLLKSLLSRRKSKKDDMYYNYSDDY